MGVGRIHFFLRKEYLCGAFYVVQSMFCNLCGASYAVQSMWCNLCCAIYVVQYMWCKLGGAIYVVQSVWCNTPVEHEVVLSTARANMPPTHPQLGWHNSSKMTAVT